MKNLSIEIIDRSRRIIKKVPYVLGKITIGDFYETFIMSIKWWKMKDYENQWYVALERLKDHDRSCLVVDAFNLNASPLINWWLIYKRNNTLHIRNEVLFQKYYKKRVGDQPFTPDTCYEFINRRTTKTIFKDGKAESEWIIPYEDQW